MSRSLNMNINIFSMPSAWHIWLWIYSSGCKKSIHLCPTWGLHSDSAEKRTPRRWLLVIVVWPHGTHPPRSHLSRSSVISSKLCVGQVGTKNNKQVKEEIILKITPGSRITHHLCWWGVCEEPRWEPGSRACFSRGGLAGLRARFQQKAEFTNLPCSRLSCWSEGLG